ncbi:hypothetical protein HO173_003496 [Letharia columbiana]|uniref:Uncharacterized protein n=1 Tax=Letharia columbiana TaxID=112416 RepID=A0A8H6L7L8_9LECA|nr:uncharacterized protein HO173_003496 [Letharia columbiana]KAF6238527.1 hypothetical protein HO173_003496 [Letharia columbiana]
MSTTHTVSLLQWQQTYDLFTEHVDNTHSEPATKWHSTHSILITYLPTTPTNRQVLELRESSTSVRSLAAEYSLWQLRTGTWDWRLRTGRPTGYWQSRRWTTTKQDSYESRQRMEWMYLMARAWETQGKSTVMLPGQAAKRCWKVNACVGFSSILPKDYGKRLERNSENLAGTQARYGQHLQDL